MGYMKIPNLYKDQRVLEFKNVYALEKIHGTSAHVSVNAEGQLNLFAGGASHEAFIALFDHAALLDGLSKLSAGKGVTVFGEAYGGKLQGMKDTYGPVLKFVAFDVQVGGRWLDVQEANIAANELGLEFVSWVMCPATIDSLNLQRDFASQQARRNGIVGDRPAEGIVIRPPFEAFGIYGERIIAKHKRKEMRETKTPREVGGASPDLAAAEAIAEEYVTEMRVKHVIDKLFPGGARPELPDTPKFIAAMADDVYAEHGDEIPDNKPTRRALGAAAARSYRKICTEVIA